MLQHKGEKHLIGTYRTEEDAARAWDRTAIHLRGPNTQTNFPIEQYLGKHFSATLCLAGPLCRLRGARYAGLVFAGYGGLVFFFFFFLRGCFATGNWSCMVGMPGFTRNTIYVGANKAPIANSIFGVCSKDPWRFPLTLPAPRLGLTAWLRAGPLLLRGSAQAWAPSKGITGLALLSLHGVGDEALAEQFNAGGVEPSRRTARRQKQPGGGVGVSEQQAAAAAQQEAAQQVAAQQWVGLQGALFDPAALQHTDWLAAAAAVAGMAAGQPGAAGMLGTMGAAVRPAPAAAAAGAEAGAPAGSGSDGCGSETDEDALRQQQEQVQQAQAQAQAQLLLLGDPTAAAVRWGDPAIEGQLQQLQGVEQTLLAAGQPPSMGVAPQDIARLLAMGMGLGLTMPPATIAGELPGQQQQAQQQQPQAVMEMPPAQHA